MGGWAFGPGLSLLGPKYFLGEYGRLYTIDFALRWRFERSWLMFGRCRVLDRDPIVIERVASLGGRQNCPGGITSRSGLVDIDDVAEEVDERDTGRRSEGERGSIDLWRVDVIGGDVPCGRVDDGGKVGQRKRDTTKNK